MNTRLDSRNLYVIASPYDGDGTLIAMYAIAVIRNVCTYSKRSWKKPVLCS